METFVDWPHNRLLRALPLDNLNWLRNQLERVECKSKQILLDADSSLDHVFFPDSGVISVVAVYANGDIIEMATIGREGFTGFQAIFGAESSSVRFLVQIPGSAARISRTAFAGLMEAMPSFRSVMFAYVQAFLEPLPVADRNLAAAAFDQPGCLQLLSRVGHRRPLRT